MSQERYIPPYDYDFDEWREQMARYMDTPRVTLESTLDDFRRAYADQSEADWKGTRLFYALWRFQEARRQHPDVFADFTSPGKVRLTSEHVVYVFWQMFGGLPDVLLTQEPPIEEIRRLLAESKASEGRSDRGP